jgi:Domain of unknown function (DUF4430)
MRRTALIACAALALSGCGLGPGDERDGGAEVRVTRDFGHERLAQARVDPIREDQTVMRLLQSQRDVETRYGGRFVQSIDGLAGGGPVGREDWFFFVNGIESSEGAAEFEVSPGDVVQWDYRDWRGAMHIPAIVGAWPEPFVSGYKGERLPTRVECDDERGRACEEVKRRLDDAGALVSGSALGTNTGQRGTLVRVVVGTWDGLRFIRAIKLLEDGPEASGVFARFRDDRLELLDETGAVARTAPPGSGLVGMTGLEDQALVFFVTGVDEPGVEAAARTLDARTLGDAFAVAATPDGVVRLPVRGEGD